MAASAGSDGQGKSMVGNSDESLIHLRLSAILYASDKVLLYQFRSPDNKELPEFRAGAHVDVHLPNGLIRQYSIASSESDRNSYLLGVRCEDGGRGGSKWLHDHARVGQTFPIGRPRNNFPLQENARTSVFVAGGIGITPICAMVAKLQFLEKHWELLYAVRRRSDAVLVDRIPAGGRFHLHVDDENDGKVLDVNAVVQAAPVDAHLYCCGPSPMIKAFEAACSGRDPQFIHVERFGADGNVLETSTSYTVELARSQRRITVSEGETLLDALQAAGVSVNVSCQQGICGTCETRVIAGVPCHRDSILSEEERAANASMMICCSSSLSDTLVLDL